MKTARRTNVGRRGGFALLTVLFVLIALLVLCAPFLFTARNASEAGSQMADQAQLRIAQDAAGRHARVVLAASHPALDATLDWDSPAELHVDTTFDPSFLDVHDPAGVMWDVAVTDEAGRIDLNSAGPHVLANVMGFATQLTEVLTPAAVEISVSTTAGFEAEGYLWIEGEIIHYAAIEGSRFVQCMRGMGATYDEKGNPQVGAQSPVDHPLGAPVLGQQALALPLWRISGAESAERALDAPEQVREAELFVLAGANQETGSFAPGKIDLVLAQGSVHAGSTGGHVWQHPMRLTSPVEGGNTQVISVSEPGWLAVGSTIRITDEDSTELAMVQVMGEDGRFILDRVLEYDHLAFDAVVSVLAKRPVNLNTASPAVLRAIFQNLKLRGRNARILPSQAAKLASLVIGMRPFEGMQDFLERLVLPAAGIGEQKSGVEAMEVFLKPPDALALYANGLNANDVQLEFSTMPFSFVSREVYGMELRATVDAPSGVERVSGVRERVELVAPQRELFFLWSRQADFDEALRLDREAPWWMSGPEATSRYDGSNVPPSRLTPHFGTVAGTSLVSTIFDPTASIEGQGTTLERVFASNEDTGFCQLWPARHSEDAEMWEGRILHFDHETRDLEGRYLPDETVRLSADDPMVRYTEPNDPLLKSFTFEAWIKPRTLDGGTILDVGGGSNETDRVTLAIEEEDLVLRVLDGFGDHRETREREAAELRFTLAPGAGPGLPVDVWSHVAVDVRGNRPTQVSMLVNGLASGVRANGLTRLTVGVGQSADVLPVESTAGFPDHGVASIGNELVEFVLESQTSLRCLHQETGPLAGFGGRLARTRYNAQGLPVELEDTVVGHPEGTPVELYGYSLPLISNLPAGGSVLRDSIGIWRVARALSAEGDGIPAGGDAISMGLSFLGLGIEGNQRRPPPFDLLLGEGDAPESEDTTFMEGFEKGGGFAAIVGTMVVVNGTDGRTSFGVPVGGIEVIRYSGWTDNRLHVIERSNTVAPKFRRWDTIQADSQSRGLFAGTEGRAFILQWDPSWYVGTSGTPLFTQMTYGCYVFPISMPASGAGTFSGFLDPIAESSDFSEHAQITHLTDAENTEWLRYDEIVDSQLTRSSPGALTDAFLALVAPPTTLDVPPGGGGGGGGGGGSSGGGGSGGGSGGGGSTHDDGDTSDGTIHGPASSAAGPPPQPPQSGSQWIPTIGAMEDEDFPLTRAAREALRFRGVMGTYTHAHEAGTPLLPVFRVHDASSVAVVEGEEGTLLLLPPEYAMVSGLPGRGDAVFVSGEDIDHIGWPLMVHRAYRPWPSVSATSWRQEGTTQEALPGTGTFVTYDSDVILFQTHVALQTPCPEPINGVSFTTGPDSTLPTDSRVYSRLSKFPSGERPRAVIGVGVGTGFGQVSDSRVPSMLVDELVFGDPLYGLEIAGAIPPSSAQGAALGIVAGMSAEELNFFVWPNNVETALGLLTSETLVLDALPADAGLLRIGEEILAYSIRDPVGGQITVAAQGRGLLGTRAQPHQRGESVTYLEEFPASTLAADIAAGEAYLPIVDATSFPREGTVLVGSELIHYTRIKGAALAMPRASALAGAMDGKGSGLFRGRFGTSAQGHVAGEAVILFPFRYWDRWTQLADAPELAYFGLQMNQPGAWWKDFFWDWEHSIPGGSRIGVLARTDASIPWDADPEEQEGLWITYEGMVNDEEIPLGVQADQIEWRVFVEYDPGAFDPLTGLSHAWKASPLFRRLGVDFLAPNRTLRSLDR